MENYRVHKVGINPLFIDRKKKTATNPCNIG